ncbi:GDP-mannose 4,6-dehydratase [Sporolactobacillus inulinus]|uniref:GDP-mannose 4,6-dehydratase n=1 Tax=Sporolactobacillus inulinus TaxID=2078 RepID=UPI0011416CF8|nr:GDP-mannose 4,6-dehydratase [Sporolactobacillus inulinus]GEB78293.1 UDP-glucose 4-epimerase [Sporolactobacillus inulinus]
MEKVLVTGGAGFIGSHVVEALLKKGYAVAVMDNFSTGRRENIANLPVDLYICDIADSSVINVVKSIHPDYIIHLAAQISVSQSVADPLFDERTNVTGSLNIMNGARLSSVKKIVFASSAAVYGNPLEIPITTEHPTRPESPYGLTKRTVENYLHLFAKFYDLHSSILRFSNVYGPRQDADGEGGVVSIFSDRIQKGTPPMIYGDGDQTRDFIFVEDVARAVVAGLSVKENLCVNVSSQTAISINDLFQLMKDVSGSDLEVYYGPKRSGDIRHSMLSNEKAKELLHWKPEVSLKDGLRMTLRALKRRKREAV